jgi:hypothetical protein
MVFLHSVDDVFGKSVTHKKGEANSLSWAGVQGFEPQLADPESAVLPLNDTPMIIQASNDFPPVHGMIPHLW